MASVDDLLASMRESPHNVRFADLEKVCNSLFREFGEPRQSSSHCIYKTPWQGDPRINIQKDKSGKAKAYQVKQVLLAFDKLKGMKSV
jgi:hypothetical protein